MRIVPLESEMPVSTMSSTEARSLTEEVKADAEALWAKCLRLYEGGAHLALGYKSWGAYWQAEFGGGKSRGYQLLEAARVVEALPDSTIVEWRPNEAQARELAPLKDSPEQMAEVLEEASANGKPTAELVKTAVVQRIEARHDDPKPVVLDGDGRRVVDVVTGQTLVRRFLAQWEPTDVTLGTLSFGAFEDEFYNFISPLIGDPDEIPEEIADAAEPYLRALVELGTYIGQDMAEEGSFFFAEKALDLLAPMLGEIACFTTWLPYLEARIAEAQKIARFLGGE